MKRIAAILIFGLFFVTPLVKAEEVTPAASSDAGSTEATTEAAPVAVESAMPAAPTSNDMGASATPSEEMTASTLAAQPVGTEAEAAAGASKAANADNLEFVSGEVSALDEPGKSLTVKLYGEAENTPTDKILKVTVDANTDITDGEADRDLKSLAVGTEVDVEYDPATNLATYIFVY